MAYKRYIKIGGKLYGPYEYHSYRSKDGSVKSKYVRKVEHENLELRKKIKFLEISVSGLSIVMLFLIILYLSQPEITEKITGKLVLDLEKDAFDLNEILSGKLKIDFAEGEFYPADSIIRINFNGQTKELTLKEFIELTDSEINDQFKSGEGEFYIINGLHVVGSGEGYGFMGYKEVPVDVFFKLEISPLIENITLEENITNVTEVSENVTELSEEVVTNITEVEENITEEPELSEENITTEENVTGEESITNETETFEENITEENINEEPETVAETVEETEENISSEETTPEIPLEALLEEQPLEEQLPEEQEPVICETSEAALTGAAIGASKIINGTCSVNNSFEYPLENETAVLVCGSVKTENKSLSDSDVKVLGESNKVEVTTDYQEKIEGFGEDFVTGKKQEIDLNLEIFNFTADKEGTYLLSLEMLYNNITIMQTSAQVVFLNMSLNVTNITNVHAPVLVKSIPDIKIIKNTNATLDLAEYFVDPDNDSLEFDADEMENISVIFEDLVATIVPEPEFVGLRETRFYASDGENETESNVVSIDVVEALNFTIQIIDKKGNVLDEIHVNDTNIKFKLNKFEVKGVEEFEAHVEFYENGDERETEEEKTIEENVTEEPELSEENITTGENVTGEILENETNFSITGLVILNNKTNNKTNKEIYSSTINFTALSNNTLIQIDKPTKQQQAKGIVTEIFAIEPDEELDIKDASITLSKINASGDINGLNVSYIGYCPVWNIKDFDCDSDWQALNISFEQDDETVSFNVSSFSAYAGFGALPEGIVITLISNTEECLVDCESIVDIYIPESLIKKKIPGTGRLMLEKVPKAQSQLINNKELGLELQSKGKDQLKVEKEHWLDTDALDLWFLKTAESYDLIDFNIKKLVNITRDKTVFDYEPCGKSPTTANATKLCVRGSHIEKINLSEWRLLLDEGLSAGHNIIKIEGKKQGKTGENNVDWKIALNVSGYQEPNLAWWNSSWTKRVQIKVYDVELENYSVRMNVTYDSDMQNDFDDLRFVDDDNTSALDYWIQEKSDGNWALIWVKVKDTAALSNQTIYMYYGNPRASAGSNISKAFLFGDDFNDNSIGSSWMNNTGPIYESDGVIFMNTSSGTDVAKLYINTTGGITGNFAIMAKVRPDYLASDYRLGVAAKHDWNGSGDGYNTLIKYNNLSSVIFLDDWNAWGNEANPGFTFSTGNWYWFEMAVVPSLMFGDNLYGRVWQVNSARPDWQITQTWDTRSGATAGVNLGYISYGSFDDFILRRYWQPEPIAYIGVTEAVELVVDASMPACTTGEAYYSSIQAAINAASSGATITVCPGTYTENVNVNKSVSIVSYSQNPSDTIVQATTTSNHAFNVTKNSSTIKGFTVRNSNYGVYLNNNVYYTTISNINFSANRRAVEVYNSKNNTINNINVTASDSSACGIYLEANSHFNSVSDANILLTGSSSRAIVLSQSSNNTLNGNNATLYGTNSFGVYLSLNSNDNVVNNSVIKANGSNFYGFYFYNGNSRNLINLNTINVTGSGSYGIRIDAGTNRGNNLTNNLIQKSDRGIYLHGGPAVDTLVKNNTILNATNYGIQITNSENNTLQENQINNSKYGLYVEGTDAFDFNHTIDTTNLINGYPIYYYNGFSGSINCNSLNQNALNNANATAGEIGKITIANSNTFTLENCNISNENSEGNAVAIVYSTNAIVRNLTSTNNKHPVYMEGTNYSNISNVKSSGFRGIYLHQSSHNFIENVRVNTTGSSDGHGIYLYPYSVNNTIRNNDVRVFKSGSVLRISYSSTANNISNNNFTSNCSSCYGAYLTNSNSNNMSYNIINTSNAHGVHLSSSHNFTENYDTIYSGNGNGIYLYSSSDNKINNTDVKTTGSNAHGIYLYSGSDRNIVNNNTINVTGSGSYGIRIDAGTNRGNNLTNNLIQKSDRGIYLHGGPAVDTLVKNNTILNATNYGIQITNSENNTLQENQINNSKYGLYVEGTDAFDFNHTIDTSNLVNGLPIYYYNGQTGRSLDCGTLNQNSLQGTNLTAGEIGKITIANSNTFTLENCNISNENSEGNAVAIVYSTNAIVRNLTSTNNRHPVYMEGTNYSNISNVKSSGFRGIYLHQSSHNFIENVRVNTTGSNGDGIYLYPYSVNNTIRNNDVRVFKSGSVLRISYSSTANNISNNNFTSNCSSCYGAYLTNSNSNNMSYNIINTSNAHGVHLSGSHNFTENYDTIYTSGNGNGIYLYSSSDNKINNTDVKTTGSNAHGIYLYSGSDRNIVNNNTINVTGSGARGVFTTSGSNTKNNFTNNVIYATGSNSVGFYFSNIITNTTVVNNTVDGNRTSPTAWAFRFDATSSATNIFSSNVIKGDSASADVNVTFTYGGSISLKGVATSARPSNPENYNNINKYINATNNSANSWLYLNISYTDLDVSTVDENSLFMARHNGTWETNTSKFSSVSGVDVTNNIVYANITSFSTFAPLGTNKSGCIGENYVFVCGDTVNESCTMNCDLNTTGTCFTIGANNIVINGSGYSINYSATTEGYGINNSGGFDNITIINIVIKHTNATVQGFGIFLNESDNSTVEYSNFEQGKAGILIMNSYNLTISHNYGSYFEYGEATEWDACQPFNDTAPWKYYESAIWLVDSNNVTIFNNTIQGNLTEEGMFNHNGTEAGITLCRSNYSNISYNTILATDTYGFIITNNSRYNTFYYNFVNGSNNFGATNTNDGIILDASSNNNNMSHNTFLKCSEWGIFLTGSDNNFIRNNTANYNTKVGIRIGGTSSYNEIYDNIANNNGDSGLTIEGNHNIARNNTFNSNQKGIYLDSSLNNTLTNNTASNNSDEGIYLDSSSNNTLTNNTLNNNGDKGKGIYLYKSSNNTITNNTASNNGYGIHLFWSSNNSVITNNTASNNSEGIYLKDSSNNIFTSNTAINNTNWDFSSEADSLNNTVINLTISSNFLISFESKDIALKNTSSPASSPPSYNDINKYINITNNSADSWIFLNVSYQDSEIQNINEATLALWKYNNSWNQVPGSGVNVIENYVYGNVTEFSIFAPLGKNECGCSNGTINYTCGDTIISSCTMNCDLNTTGTCFTIGANNIVINGSGYSINYSATTEGYGIINNRGYDNITITNIVIKHTNATVQGFGIFLNESDNSTVEYSNFEQGKAGILIMNSYNLTIRHNYGSYFEYGWAAEWDACQPFNDTAPWKYYESAIWLVDSNNVTIFNNTIQGNLTGEGWVHDGTEAGITLCRSNYSNISYNTILATDTYGFMITNNSRYNTFYYNFVNGSNNSGAAKTNDGIILDHSPNNNMSHNTFLKCEEWGIFLTGSDNNFIRNNTANYNNIVGIRIGGTSSYNEIYDNIANNNIKNGLRIEGNHNIVRNNTFNSNLKGVSFESYLYSGYCSNNIVKDTKMNSNDYGIYVYLNTLSSCTNNLVWDSNITNSASEDVLVTVLEGNQTFNLTLLNVSFDKNKVFINNSVSGEMYVQWYLDAYVMHSNGTAVGNANVSAWDKNAALTFTKLTGQGLPNYKSNGWTNMYGNVLLYHLDEASGTIVDYSGEGNNGTNNGATYGAAGKFNTALGFDGVDDYVNVPAAPSLKPSNITIEAWVKPMESTNSTNWFGFLKGAYGDGYSNGWRFIDIDDHIDIQMNFGDASPIGVSGSVLTVGEWTHVVATYDHQYLRLYKDGVEVGNISETRDINWAAGGDLQVGFAQFYFNGTIDEVAIYNRALSAAEIAQHYNASGYIERQNVTEYYQNATAQYFLTNYSINATKNEKKSETELVNLTTNKVTNDNSHVILTLDSTPPLIYFVAPTPANNTKKKSTDNWGYINVTVVEDSEHSAYIDWNRTLRGYWRFNELSGTVAYDNSSWGNNGTLYNDANWTSGKRGNAVTFDGDGDYVRVDSDNGLNIRDALTVEMWIYPRSFKTSSPYISGLAERKAAGWDQWIVRLGDADLAATRVQFVTTTSEGVTKLNGVTDLSTNNWYHVVVTWSTEDNTKRIYINGVQEPVTQNTVGQINDLADGYIDIGIDAGSATRVFDGIIDELKVYSRVLSPQEINASYNNGLYRLERNFTNLSGGNYTYYACAQDLSGNSNCTETRLLKINRVPSQVSLLAPPNGNETSNHTTNRTPLFNWTASTDDDGDSLQYVLNILCYYNHTSTGCSPADNRLIENLTLTNYALETVLKNFWDTLESYNWSIKAWDGLEYGPVSDVWELYIDSLVALSTINSTASFSEMAPGTTDDTVDNVPWPISIQNDGNCFINVSIFGTQLWQATPEINETYQYKFDYLEQNSFNWSGSVTDWANVPIGFTISDILYQFNYNDSNDSAEVDIKLAPLSYEPSGNKSSNITLTGSFVDVAE